MPISQNKITVFYDGSCPRCVQDRKDYESKDPNASEMVEWFDITNQEETLLELGIDPYKALTELHLRDTDGTIHSELDAYRILMRRIPSYRVLGWLISLPLIKPLSSKLYHWLVIRRLRKAGRLKSNQAIPSTHPPSITLLPYTV